MKTQYFLMALGLMLLLIPLATALEDSQADFNVKQFQGIDLKKPCISNNSEWCTTAAVCNITVTYMMGDGKVLYNNTIMTNQISYHNLTLKSSDTQLTGWYQGQIICVDGISTGDELFYWKVTPTGEENNTTLFLIIAGVLIAVIILGYTSKNLYITFLGGTATLILGMYSMIFGMADTANDYTRMIAAIEIGVGFIILFSSAYTVIDQNKDTGYEEEITTDS